jgi:CRISPR/Cas system-associated endonuclease Cas1
MVSLTIRKREMKFAYFPAMRTRRIELSCSIAVGQFHSTLLNWIAEQRITLVQLNWRGAVSFVGNSSGYSAKREIADAQIALKGSKKALSYSRSLIEEKIRNSISTLKGSFPATENREMAISSLTDWMAKVRNSTKVLTLSNLLGVEGGAAFSYFRGWHGTQLKWRDVRKKPVPDHWLQIGPRTMT